MLVQQDPRGGSIPVCATLPPCSDLEAFAWQYNTEMYQQSKMRRVPLIDLREIMRSGPDPIDGRSGGKVPTSQAVRQNRFASGFEPVVRQQLAEITALIEGK